MFRTLLRAFCKSLCRRNSKMVNPPVLEATFASGIILIATGFYGTQFLINHSGSDMAKLAIETNSECLLLDATSDYYTNCTYRLEELMKNLTESGEIRTEDCELDEADNNIVYCPVWVWYYPQWLPTTDVTIIGVMGSRADKETIRASPKLEQMFSQFSEISQKLSDLPDEENTEHLKNLENMFSSQPGIPQQLTDLSDRGKEELSPTEVDEIMSAMLDASKDLINLIGKMDSKETDSLDYFENVFLQLIGDDSSGGLITQELKNILSKTTATALQMPNTDTVNDIIQDSLQALSENLNLNDIESLMENPDLLLTLLQSLNTNEIENVESSLMETLAKSLNINDLEDPIGKLSILKTLTSMFGKNGFEDIVGQFGDLNKYLQDLETEEIVDILNESGLTEIVMHHLETHFLNDALESTDIERALAQNLKENHYFENALKSGIAEELAENLQNIDSKIPFNKLGFLKLLSPSLLAGPAGSLDKSGFIKKFLQNLDTSDVENLLTKSGLIKAIPNHIEPIFFEAFHDKSGLSKALVENIKTNRYIEDSAKADLIKQLDPNIETEDKKKGDGELGLISSLSEKLNKMDFQTPFNNLHLLKLLSAGLDSNVLQNPRDNIDLVKAFFQNLKKENVEEFIKKSGLVEPLVQPLETIGPEKPLQNIELSNQAIVQNDKTGGSLNSDQMKSFQSNPDIKNADELLGMASEIILDELYTKEMLKPFNFATLKLLAPSLKASVLENPSNKLGLVKALLHNVDIQEVANYLGKSGIIEALLQAQTSSPKEFDGKLNFRQQEPQNGKHGDKNIVKSNIKKILNSNTDMSDLIETIGKSFKTNNP